MINTAACGASPLAQIRAPLLRAPQTEDGERGSPPPTNGQRLLATAFTGSSYDAQTRSVEITIATGFVVRRGWYSEELSMEPAAIDLSRVPLNQVRLLFNHNPDDPIGVISDVRIEAGQLVGRATFADTPRGREFAGMAERGELTGISAGYRVRTWTLVQQTDEHEHWRADAWELLEASVVSVPADPHAGVRSISPVTTPSTPDGAAVSIKEEDMRRSHPDAPAGSTAPAVPAAAAAPAPAPAPEAGARALGGLTAVETLQALSMARAVGVAEADIQPELTRADASVASVNAAILAAAARRQTETAVPAGQAARTGVEAGELQRDHMVDALVSRMTMTVPSEAARQYRGVPIWQLMAIRMGVSSRDPFDVMQRAMHTTSDFPMLLEAAANKVLLNAYMAAAPTYRALAARRSFQDFKPHKFLRIGEFPALVPLGENGEVKSGTIPESRESVSIVTRARNVSLSRQAIINDDLGAFADLVNAAGRAAARAENKAFFALLNANGNMSDGLAMFHATHGNLAGTGAVISITTLGAGRAAMRKQKNVAGDEFLNIQPRILLAGPDQETLAQQITGSTQPVVATEVNPFSGRLDVVSDAEMTGNSWYLFADPTETPNFIYGYLRDQEGPAITQDRPFGIDGVSLQVIHDFGVGAVDFRGGYRNPGA